MKIKRITIMMMMIVITTEGFRPLNLVTCSKLYLRKMLFSSSGKDFNVKIITKIRAKYFNIPIFRWNHWNFISDVKNQARALEFVLNVIRISLVLIWYNSPLIT